MVNAEKARGRKAVKFNGPMPWISPHKLPSRGASAASKLCAVCKNEQRCDPLTAILAGKVLPALPRPAAAAQPPPPPGGRTTHRCPSAVIPAPKAAAGCREQAGGPGFSCPGRRRESHPPAVLCYFHRGRGKTRLHIYIPRGCGQAGAGPLSAVGSRGRCTHASTPWWGA
jgi:hypothetical protein